MAKNQAQEAQTTSSRAQAAKDLGSTQIKGMKDSAKGVVDTAKGFITGGPVGAIKAAVPAIGTVAKDAFNLYKNLFKVIFNDSSIYGGNHDIPVNEQRPMGMHYYKGLAPNSTFGFIPKLNELHIKLFEFSKSNSFNENIDTLFEQMRFAMRSNLTYSKAQVKRFILNNITLYILAKYYEKRLGFVKYEDPYFPEFHTLWRKNEVEGSGYNVIRHLTDNADFSSEENLAHTLDIYAEMCRSSFRFVLPENMKKWIDHYIGSVFVLDDDVANPKYLSIVPEAIPYYNDDDTITYWSTNGLTIAKLFALIQSFRDVSVNSTIRTDICKVPTLMNAKDINMIFALGWLTPYEEYTPTPIIDVTLKQALINGYTSKSSVSSNHFIRIDALPDNGGDNLTTLLFMGATYNDVDQAKVFNCYGIEVIKLSTKVFASSDNPVVLQEGMLQSGSHTFDDTFAVSLVTDVSSDVYINVSTTGQGRIYWPNGTYFARGTQLVAEIVSDEFMTFDWQLDVGNTSPRLLIPVAYKDTQQAYLLLVTDVLNQGRNVFTNAIGTSVMFATDTQVSQWSILRKAVSEHIPVIINDALYQVLGTANERIGRTGRCVVDYYQGSYNVDLHFTTIQIQDGDQQTEYDYQWYTTCVYPNGDLKYQYVIGTVANTDVSSHSGYIFTSQWFYNALGYCIPVVNSLTLHMQVDGRETTKVYAPSLMKEDYIPTLINVNDIPAVMSKMIDGLTRFHK